MKTTFFLHIVSAVFMLTTIAGISVAQVDEIRGHLFVIGGGSEPRALMRAFVNQSGGADSRILILPTASSEPETGNKYLEYFTGELSCSNAVILNVRNRATAETGETVANIRSAAGVFITGGDQRRLLEIFQGSAALEALQEAFASGTCVAGTSAGAAVLGMRVITGDGDFSRIGRNLAHWRPGFGLARDIVFDQHFVERSRQNRLLGTILGAVNYLGVGIDSGTAVWLRPNRTMEVFGSGWVFIYDSSHAAVTAREEAERVHSGAHNLTLHILQKGDVYRIGPATTRIGKHNSIVRDKR